MISCIGMNILIFNFFRDELIKYLRDFREQRNNTLSGLTVDDIIAGVSKLVRENYSPADKV